MLEPVPRELLPPSKEAPIRIGIVLPEDKRNSLAFQAKTSGYTIETPAFQTPLLPNTRYAIRYDGHGFQLHEESAKQALGSGPIILRAAPGVVLAPKAGIEIEKIVAGRGFHWQKELTESFSGNIEIQSHQGFLIAVSELPFEDYIASVTSSEMNPNSPQECAKAQAVVARTWSLLFLGEKHKGLPFSICNDDDCQRYQGTTHLLNRSIDAVRATAGEILLNRSGVLCATYYSKCCGGFSETPRNAFGFDAQGVTPICDGPKQSSARKSNLSVDHEFQKFLEHDAVEIFCAPGFVPAEELQQYLGVVDDAGAYFRWKEAIDGKLIIQNLTDKFGLREVAAIRSLHPGPRGVSGRITSLGIEWRDRSGSVHRFELRSQYDIRRALHPRFLKSSAFIFEIEADKEGSIGKLNLHGLGWGHGVGLCQIGSLGMALNGSPYKAILEHYFPETTLFKIR